MDVFLPKTLSEALDIMADHPETMPIAGGTDVMVEINFDRHRPDALMDLTRIAELNEWRREDGGIFVGAGVTYARIMRELPQLRAWVQAARTVGSPQIRNRATVGGNLGTASPAGDALPVIAAHDADVVMVSTSGERSLPWHEFLVGVKRNALRPDELILGVRWRAFRGTGSFSKIGTRNAMVISMAGLCLLLDEDARRVRVALGSVAPTIVRASDAEAFAAAEIARAGGWDDPGTMLHEGAFAEFGERVAAAAQPIDDIRGTARYRRHACSVLGRRALAWALADRRG